MEKTWERPAEGKKCMENPGLIVRPQRDWLGWSIMGAVEKKVDLSVGIA